MVQDNQNVKIIGGVQIKGANGLDLNMIPWIAEVVTPNVSTTLPTGLLFIGGAGDVIVRPAGQGTFVTFKGLAAGSFLPVYINAVSGAAGTTATDLLICY